MVASGAGNSMRTDGSSSCMLVFVEAMVGYIQVTIPQLSDPFGVSQTDLHLLDTSSCKLDPTPRSVPTVRIMLWLVLLFACNPPLHFWQRVDGTNTGTCLPMSTISDIAYIFTAL
ncbi:hypothetical protein N7465_010085 [Penicillium sp. CMV-2018d]|nr:hypothetical protein N7465_010085 [Penicillium sp. CMV-2018d]